MEFGYALSDIITEISKRVLLCDWPDEVLGFLTSKLSDIELRLSHGASEKLQLGALVGAFITARDMMTDKGTRMEL